MTRTAPERAVYIEVTFDVPRATADAVCNFIIENICSGLVLEEPDDLVTTGIKFYVSFDDDKDFKNQLEAYFQSLLGDTLAEIPDITTAEVETVEWEKQYRESVTPVWITEDIVVRPPWGEPPVGVTHEIIIEPKMAFGTGKHETTRSVMCAMQKIGCQGARFLDIGCGSGVLSVLASRLGAKYIKAVDYDIIAIDNCRENLEINQVTTPADIVLGSIEQCQHDAPFQVICANIIRSTILAMLPRLKSLTAEGGTLIISGILCEEQKEISGALTALGLTDFDVRPDNDWLTYTVRRF